MNKLSLVSIAFVSAALFLWLVWPTPYSTPFGYVTKDSANVVRYNRITRAMDCYWWSDGVWRPWKKPMETGSGAAQKDKGKDKIAKDLEKGAGAKTPEDKIMFSEALAKRAEAGDAEAQYALGVAYCRGQGVAQDFGDAVRWYLKSAEQGHPDAQCNLAMHYFKGEGVDRDMKKAVDWWKKSAEQGNAKAQCNLGECYQEGKGVEKDENQAAFWWKKSAEQGYLAAQMYLKYSSKGKTDERAFVRENPFNHVDSGKLYFRIYNCAVGDSVYFSTFNENTGIGLCRLFLEEAGSYTGQYWDLRKDGLLSNQFLGPSRVVASNEQGELCMGVRGTTSEKIKFVADVEGKNWKIILGEKYLSADPEVKYPSSRHHKIFLSSKDLGGKSRWKIYPSNRPLAP